MKLIAVGANLSGPAGPPLAQCEAALARLAPEKVTLRHRSGWFESAPVPPSGQPWFVNGVAEVDTLLGPVELLAALHRIEDGLGRVRSTPNAARAIDLDLLDFDSLVRDGPEPPILPHPRLAQRAFVLMPLAEVAPGWRHPLSGRTVGELIAALPSRDGIRRLG